jgi:hypothetical protein
MAKQQSTELAEQTKGELATIYDYGNEVGKGFENQTSADVAIPFISILQDLSPQVKKNKAEYIAGAEPGILINTVTQELLPDGIEFIPATTEHFFVEWVPRNKGGGFVARHAPNSEVVAKARAISKDFGKLTTKEEDGNDLVETFYVYGIAICNGTPIPAIVAFSSTKIRVYKRWMTRVRTFQIDVNGRKQVPPLFAHLARIGTVPETNKRGEDFFNFSVEPANGDIASSLLPPTDERFQAARLLREAASRGAVRAADETLGSTTGGAADMSDVPF